MVRLCGWLAIGLAALVVGCDSGNAVCSGNCPDVSGAFSLIAPTPSGSCKFASYLPPPTLTLAQSNDGSHVSTQLIDPTNQLLVSIDGSVLPSDSSTSGTFQMQMQLVRQMTRDDPTLVTLQVNLSGTVSRSSGRANLTSTLTETQLDPTEGSGCTVTIPLTGQMGQ